MKTLIGKIFVTVLMFVLYGILCAMFAFIVVNEYRTYTDAQKRTEVTQALIVSTKVVGSENNLLFVNYEFMHPTQGSVQAQDQVGAREFNELNLEMRSSEEYYVPVYYDSQDKMNSSLSANGKASLSTVIFTLCGSLLLLSFMGWIACLSLDQLYSNKKHNPA